MNDTTATDLRKQAAAKYQEAIDSFDRCDTDGALSQWASGLSAQRLHLQADIEENGGVARFVALFDTDGNWVPAKRIDAKWGPRWMVLDADGKRTGEYLPYMPKRRDTLANKGYVEGYVMRQAKADYRDYGHGLTSVRVVSVPTQPDHFPPAAIVSTDRFAD